MGFFSFSDTIMLLHLTISNPSVQYFKCASYLEMIENIVLLFASWLGNLVHNGNANQFYLQKVFDINFESMESENKIM